MQLSLPGWFITCLVSRESQPKLIHLVIISGWGGRSNTSKRKWWCAKLPCGGSVFLCTTSHIYCHPRNIQIIMCALNQVWKNQVCSNDVQRKYDIHPNVPPMWMIKYCYSMLQSSTGVAWNPQEWHENEVPQVGSAHRIDLYFESEHFLKGSLNWWSQTTLNEIDIWNQMSNSETNETLKSRLLRPFYECQSTLDRIRQPGPSLRAPKLWYYVW